MNLRAFVDCLSEDELIELRTWVDEACGLREQRVRRLPELNETEINEIASGRWIKAVKSYRSRTNCSLKIAKEKIDPYR